MQPLTSNKYSLFGEVCMKHRQLIKMASRIRERQRRYALRPEEQELLNEISDVTRGEQDINERKTGFADGYCGGCGRPL